jgi:hypothetical protein
VLLLAALIAAAWPGDAGSAPPPTVLLGKTTSTPSPACPGTARQECQAIGRVTGFQALAGNESQPFVAPFDGAVVAWSVTLSRPNRKERSFFDDLFGSPPKARIAVLRRIKGKRPPAFMMVRQSPVQVLTPYLGHTVVFALVHPLVVLKGQVVALTIPTWAPALAIDLNGARNTWRGSRKAGTCSSSDKDIESSNPQQRVRSKRQYGCYFSTSRLLYTATVVKKPVKKQRRSRAARAPRGPAVDRAVPVG